MAKDGLLSAAQLKRFADDWNAGMLLRELAEKYQLHRSQVSEVRDRLGLKPRRIRRVRRIASDDAIAEARRRIGQ